MDQEGRAAERSGCKDNETHASAGDLGFYGQGAQPSLPTCHQKPKCSATGSGVVVPPAVARRGSYIAKGAILMPSYV